jgi:3-oxoacyl-[acyl-carrier protein] reductase
MASSARLNYHYNAKGAALLTKTLAIELSFNIRVNSVCPGYIETEITQAMDSPDRRTIKPKSHCGAGDSSVVASDIAFASDDAAFVHGDAI